MLIQSFSTHVLLGGVGKIKLQPSLLMGYS